MNAIEWFNEGNSRHRRGDNAAAEEAYTRSIETGGYWKAYGNRGTIRVERGDLRGALDDFNESIRLQPGDSLAYHMRGVVHRNLGDSAAALADFNEAIRRSPRDAAPRLNRSSLLESLGRLDEVLQEIEILLTLDMPDWAREEVAQRRARALAARDTGNELSQFPRRFEAGEFAAVEEAATAMLRGGRSEEAHLWRAACRLRRGDVEGALADLEIGLTRADRAYQNGWELFRENRIPAAVAECRRARTRHAAAEVWVSWLETRA